MNSGKHRRRRAMPFVVTALIVVLAACGESGTTTTTTATTNPTTTTPTDGGAEVFAEVHLTVHDWGPSRPLSYGYEWWTAEVTRRTGGAVTFDLLYSEALGAAADQIENTGAGVFDAAIFAAPYHPAKTPLWNICCLPGMAPGPEPHALALMNEYHDIPEVEDELQRFNVKMLFVISLPSQEYMGTVPLRTLDDFEGVRVQAVGVQAEYVSRLGMVPVNIPSSEVYEAIQRGTIDGVLFPWNTHTAFSIHEVTSYAVEIGGGQVAVPFVINQDVWNGLEPKLQALMTEVAALVPAENARYLAEADQGHLTTIKEAGVEFIVLDPADITKIRTEVAEPLWQEWADARDAEGLPGELALQTLTDAIEHYSD